MDVSGNDSFQLKSEFGLKAIFDFNHRERAGFCDEVDDLGRASLGIINLNGLEVKRESLGPLNISITDFLNGDVPDIQITDFTPTSSNSNNVLNNAFYMSTRANLSSVNSLNPSFNSASLISNVPSTISSTSSYKSDILNDVFINSSDFLKKLQHGDLKTLTFIKKATVNEPQRRLKSLPSHLEENYVKDAIFPSGGQSQGNLNKNSSVFSDLVFIEANHLAGRISDGSILELDEQENDMLDLITKPVDLENISNQSNEKSAASEKLQVPVSDSSNVEIQAEVSDDKELEIYKVLDLSRKSQLNSSVSREESYENCGPLDLSMKSKSATSENSFPNLSRFNKSQPEKSLIKLNGSLRNSNSSVSSNESKSLTDLGATKFKLKKTEAKPPLKKGPLKAMVSVKNMTKQKSVESKVPKTPPQRNESHFSFKMKRTSTPVNEMGIKPVAQSTPEYSQSPLNQSLRNMKHKLNYSGTNIPAPKNQSMKRPTFSRTLSAEDIKKRNAVRKLNRSYSVGENCKSAKNKSIIKSNTGSAIKQIRSISNVK